MPPDTNKSKLFPHRTTLLSKINPKSSGVSTRSFEQNVLRGDSLMSMGSAQRTTATIVPVAGREWTGIDPPEVEIAVARLSAPLGSGGGRGDTLLLLNIGLLIPLNIEIQVIHIYEDPLTLSHDGNRSLPNQFSHAPQRPAKVMGSLREAIKALGQGICNPLLLFL
jgi:hypothetical protein